LGRLTRQIHNQMLLNGGMEPKGPFLIGVAGGTASGKTSVCRRIVDQLGQTAVSDRQRQVVLLSQDSFYRNLNHEEKNLAFKGEYNFDHPDAFDFDLTIQTLKDIQASRIVHIPAYDFKSHQRLPDESITVYPADVVLMEGILVFYNQELRDMFHMKLFVDTDPDTRLSRRVLRDMSERGRDLEQILHQYTNFVKPAFEEFCLPTKKYADVIIPRGADNLVAIDLIGQHIQELLRANGQSNGHGIHSSRMNRARARHNSDSQVGRPH